MAVNIAKNYDPVTIKPLAPLEEWLRYGNNSLASLGLMAEGGTVNQSYFINSLTDVPFNIEVIHLYQDDETKYSTDIQIYGNPMRDMQSALGTPYLKFYLLSPSESSRVYTIQQNEDGDEIQVPHMTLDEYTNSFSTAIADAIVGDDGSGTDTTIEGASDIDRFLKCFSNVCNIGTYVIPGVGMDATLTYLDLYYYDQTSLTLRQKFDVLVFASLPYNNINIIDTDIPIEVTSSDYTV